MLVSTSAVLVLRISICLSDIIQVYRVVQYSVMKFIIGTLGQVKAGIIGQYEPQ